MRYPKDRRVRPELQDQEPIEVEASELEPADPPHLVHSDSRASSLLPDAGFWEHDQTELVLLVDRGELWLFACAELGAFSASSSDLLVQLKIVDQIPVAMLTLFDAQTHTTRRSFFDPAGPAREAVSDVLGRSFQATVVLLDEQRRLHGTFRLEAPRAENARMMLDRVTCPASYSRERWKEAANSCRANPPPVAGHDHPFVLQEDALDAVEARQRLQGLESWCTPERIDEALLFWCVPHAVFELSRRQIIADAIRFGIAMSDEVLVQAVRFGFAPDCTTLVADLRRRFSQIVPFGSEHGFDAAALAANAAALGRLEASYGASTDPGLSCTMDPSG